MVCICWVEEKRWDSQEDNGDSSREKLMKWKAKEKVGWRCYRVYEVNGELVLLEN